MKVITNSPKLYLTRTRLVLKEEGLGNENRVRTRARKEFIETAEFDERGYVKVP